MAAGEADGKAGTDQRSRHREGKDDHSAPLLAVIGDGLLSTKLLYVDTMATWGHAR